MNAFGSRLNAAKVHAARYGDRVRVIWLARLDTAKSHHGAPLEVTARGRTVPLTTSAPEQAHRRRLPSPRWLPRGSRPTRDTALAAVFLCVAFYVAAQIGLALHFPASLVYFVWPPSVLVFVALVLSPRRDWWIYFLALLPVHLLAEWNTVAAPPALLVLFYAAVWTQALVGALCVERFAGRPLHLGTLRALIIFLLGAAAAAVTEALTLATTLVLTTRGADFWLICAQTVLADALTMVVLAPALMIAWDRARRVRLTTSLQTSLQISRAEGRRPDWLAWPAWLTNVTRETRSWLRTVSIARATEASLLALALLGIGLVAFGGYVSLPVTLPVLLYAVLPLLLWTGVRFGLGGTSLALCGLTLLSIIYAIHGRGPFSTLSTTENLFSLQLFFIAIAVPLLVLAVLMRERQEARRGLEQSEARYRDLVESQTEMICRYLPDSTLTFVNEAYCQTYGKPREKLIGTKFLDFMDQPERDHHAKYTAALLASAHTATDEHEVTLPDGDLRWQQWVDHPICDANGQVVEIQAVGRDTTDSKRAEDALQESEARFRAAFESAASGMMLIDTTGRALQVNRPLAAMLGYSEAELLTHTFMDLTYPDDLAANLALFRAGLAGEIDTYQLEKRLIRKDGNLVWAVVSAGVVRDAAGQARYVIGQLQDITERKQAEEALRASEERYRAVVNNFPHGIVLLFGRDLRHIFADGQGLPEWGLAEDAVVGKTVWEAFPADLAATLAPHYQAALAGAHAAFDLAYAGHTYQTQVLSIRYTGATAGMVVMQDVTEQRRVEVLAELDRAKTAFFSNVSHEFRTPLTLLLGPAADALADRDAPLPPSQRQRLELIQRGGLRLHKLVNSLLDFSRLEAGRVQATYEPLDVAALTADLASLFRSAIERAGLRLIVETEALSILAKPVYVDRDMWEQIVFNLLSNALKFTFEGSITVTVRASVQSASGQVEGSEKQVGPEDERVELEVRDTGTGIPLSELPHLFDRFYRVHGAQARTQEGAGIGLALVQELVRLHAGTVQVASTLGAGTAFTVTIPTGDAHLPADRIVRRAQADEGLAREARAQSVLPFVEEALRWLPQTDELGQTSREQVAADTRLELADNHTAPSDSGTDGGPLVDVPAPPSSKRPAAHSYPLARILVADDNADMRAYLARLLGERWEVQTVADGAAALVAAGARPPDLILADVMMPGLDGFALVAALRVSPQTEAVPIILLSARAGEEATVEGLQAGANDYLIKPFSARELLARVQTHLELAQARNEAATRAAQMEAIFEAISDGVLVHDLAGNTMHANRAYRDLLRRHLEMRGLQVEPDTLFAAPAEREHYISINDEQGQPIAPQVWATERALRGETLTGAHAVDEFTQGNDGTTLQVNVSAAPVRNASGRITGSVAVFRDVTARRQLERQVAEQASQLQAVFEAMTDGVVVLDVHGHVTRINAAAQTLFTLATGEDRTLETIDSSPAERAHALDLRDRNDRPFPIDQLPTARLLRGEVLAGPTALALQFGSHADERMRTINLTGGPLRDATTERIVGAVAVVRDVTELQRTQAALVEQERLFRTLVENSPDIITRFDRNLRHLYVSPVSEVITGIPAHTRLGRTYAEIGLPEAVYGPWEQAMKTVFATGQSQLFETSYQPNGRSPRVSQVRYIPEFSGDGSVESVLGITTDITELKRTEEALRQSEERFSKAFHASPVAMAIVSRTSGRILDANEAECELLGYSGEQLFGHTVAELGLVAPADLQAVRSAQGLSTGVRDVPIRARTKSGEERFCLVSTEPIRLGREECSIAITLDVTERRRTEDALRRQERLFRTLVENSPDIIARFDRDLRYLYINPAITRVGPIPPERYLGRTNQELGWPEAQYGPAYRAMQDVFQSGQSQILLEDDSAFRDGQDAHYFRAQILPEFAEDGTTVESVLTVTTEITDLKRAEEALRAATAVAEAVQHEEEHRRHEAERREQIAESLRDVLTILNSNRQVTKILDYIARQAGRLLSSDAAAIFTIGTDRTHGAQAQTSGAWAKPPAEPPAAGTSIAQGSLTLQAAFGLPTLRPSSRDKRRTAVGEAAIRSAMATRRPVVVLARSVTAPEHAEMADGSGSAAKPAGVAPGEQSEQTEDNVQPSADYLVAHEEPLPAPYQALLAIPIIAQGQVYGGLLLLYTAPRRFSPDEVALAAAYSDQIALAMANAWLQDHIEREAVERERNRLARELHDTVTQEIFTASVLAESIPQVWEHHRTEAETTLRQLHQLTRGALAALRALLLELRPKVLEQKALPELLQQLGAAMTPRSGVPIAMTIADDCAAALAPGASGALPTEVKLAFYRIAQEALMNAAKYAQAHSISVDLRCLPAAASSRRGGGGSGGGSGVQLEVQDDGNGFEAGAVPAGHFGLGMMQERARAVGATLRITSHPGQGTRVAVKWTNR